MRMITDAQIADIRLRHPMDDFAAETVKLRKYRKGKMIGPCPICSSDPKSSTDGRFECDAESWVCAVCTAGGDVIAFVRKRDGVSFEDAIAILGGAAEVQETVVTAGRRGGRDFRQGHPMIVPSHLSADPLLSRAYIDGWRVEQRKAAASDAYRERERKRLYRFYNEAARLHNSAAIDYLRDARGLEVPPHAKLRGHSSFPMFADGKENEPVLLHRGPAKLAPILNASGVFSGLHITWFDLAQPKGKLLIIDPATGETMPVKKSRGTKAGGYIDLGYAGDCPGPRMFIGEGNETVMAAYTSLLRAGRLRPGDRFRGAVDRGNLGGKAMETVAHPTLKTDKGRALRVPGPEADDASPIAPVPDDVEELIILGDGDSDPFTTRNAVQRAMQRHARPGRIIRDAWPH